MDERRYFIEAALRYEELLESGQQISLDQFVAGEPEATRAELRAFLEFNLTLGELDAPAALTPEQEARADAVLARARERWSQPVRNLTQLRSARRLTVGRLARQLRLPVDVLARIERGKVAADTIPQRLVQQLADLLQEQVATVQAALSAPPPQVTGARLSAADGTVEAEEPVVSFAQAFAESHPTPEQRDAWGDTVP
ncbi:MAG: XRE family transcriptional regulator [Chloroflexota bacterium]